MAEDSENKDKIIIDEKEAKKQFFEELKNKNLKEKKKLEETKKAKIEEEKQPEDNKEEVKKQEVKQEVKKEETKKEENKKQQVKKQAVNNITKQQKKEKDKIKDIPQNQKNEKKESTVKKDDFSKISKMDSQDMDQNKSGFFNKRLKWSIIDTIVTGVVSIAIVYLIDLILRLAAGYYIADMKSMFIIVFIIVLILYPFVMSKTKFRATLGEKFSK
jgi:lipopolysaccharide export LptBFGC system permease protein LptF